MDKIISNGDQLCGQEFFLFLHLYRKCPNKPINQVEFYKKNTVQMSRSVKAKMKLCAQDRVMTHWIGLDEQNKS